MIEVNVSDILPNKNQPRKYFDKKSLSQLAESIKKHGLLENLIVREQNDAGTIPKGKYELVCGERRLKACVIAGVTQVTVTVKDLTDKEAFELSLTENIQRDNLSPMEEAQGYKKLQEYHSQGEISSIVNKSRTRINQIVKLLELPEDIHPFFNSFSGIPPLSERHGRILLRFKRFLDKVVKAEPKECYHVFDEYWKPGYDSELFFKEYSCCNKHALIKDCLLYDAAQGAYFQNPSLKEFEDEINWFMFSIIRIGFYLGSDYKPLSEEECEALENYIGGEFNVHYDRLTEEEKTSLSWWGLERTMKPIAHQFIGNKKELQLLEYNPRDKHDIKRLQRDRWFKKYGIDAAAIDSDMSLWYMDWANKNNLLGNDEYNDEMS